MLSLEPTSPGGARYIAYHPACYPYLRSIILLTTIYRLDMFGYRLPWAVNYERDW